MGIKLTATCRQRAFVSTSHDSAITVAKQACEDLCLDGAQQEQSKKPFACIPFVPKIRSISWFRVLAALLHKVATQPLQLTVVR
jgi:hypothetical protein